VAPGTSGQPQGQKTLGPTRDLLGWEWRHLWQLCQGDASLPLGRGHKVRGVAFSPDGGLLAIGKDKTVEVIDPKTRDVIARLDEFDDDLNHNGLAFSHQGRYLAAKGGTVARIWEVGKWDAPIRQFESAAHVFNNAVEFSADDATFATRVPGGVQFWDTSTWQESHFEQSGATFGTVLHYSHDGQWLAISDWHKIEIRSPKYELLASFEAQIGWVTAIDSTAQFMAAGYREGEVIVWETKTWREVGKFRAHPSFVLGLDFAPDGQTLVTGGSDQLIKIWDVTQLRADLTRTEPPSPVRILRGHEAAIYGLAYSPAGASLASTGKDGMAKLWNSVGAREASELPNSKEPLWFAPDGTRLITLDTAGRLRLWDTGTRRDLGPVGPPLDVSQLGRAISSDGKWLALGMSDGVIELWNLKTNKQEREWKEDDDAIGHMTFSSGGTMLAAANNRRADNEQGTVRIWDMVSGRPVLELENAYGPLVFSTNDRRLASTRLDGSAVIWDLASGLAMAEIPEDIIMSGGLAFSPMDDRLASGSEAPIVHMWDVASRAEVDSLLGSRMCIRHVGFAPDGRTLLAQTVDNAIKLWNVPTGAELLDLGHIMEATSFLFSPNGEYLALSTVSGVSREPRVELWRAPSFEEIAAAEARRAGEIEPQ
jgi:WD40 repeat protein